VGYNFSQRISFLKQQTDDNLQGRIRLLPAFFRVFLPLAILSFVLNISSYDNYNLPTGETADPDARWEALVNQQFEERLHWLQATPFFLSPGGAGLYERYGQSVVSTFHHKREKRGSSDELLSLDGLHAFFSQFFTNLFLRVGFVAIAFWPFWFAAYGIGYYAFRHKFRGKRTDDLLGVCDRGVTPFYSGIYGPLRSNNSFSATDYSCPNLACPQMVKPDAAKAHRLGQLLEQYGASNATNTELVSVILYYHDFPAIVEGEQASEEEPDPTEIPDKHPVAHQSTIITNAGGTIEQSAVEGLEAVLSAHTVLRRYVETAQQRKLTHAQLNSQYRTHAALLTEVSSDASPFARILLAALSPHRVWAFAQIPPAMVASAYLATEAGKCLVYRREGAGFTRISRYPHLQARAVLQSLVPYARDYNGDTRLIIRQAIICSRRHGDFGRAFLPDRMPVESRAMRDWLEIMYSEPKKREIVAQLVELDVHIEEISMNWRAVYSRRMRQALEVQNAPEETKHAETPSARFWKGVVFKSVVLMPLTEVIAMALRGVDEGRLKRITQLINLSQRYQTSISISARLPGFKRQAVEAQNAVQMLAGKDGSKGLLDRWVIVRRMLTRYNWLSTRVGDDAVPANGFVHGIVLGLHPDTQQAEVYGLDSLVPIRQRRYEEMFGKQWESLYFIDSPHPSQIRLYVDKDRFDDGLKQERANAARNLAGGSGAKSPTAASA
jgi:hypothetical protein